MGFFSELFSSNSKSGVSTKTPSGAVSAKTPISVPVVLTGSSTRTRNMTLFSEEADNPKKDFRELTAEHRAKIFQEHKCAGLFFIKLFNNGFDIYKVVEDGRVAQFRNTLLENGITDYSFAVKEVKKLTLDAVEVNSDTVVYCYYDGYNVGYYSTLEHKR